jgi:hypothetical protein
VNFHLLDELETRTFLAERKSVLSNNYLVAQVGCNFAGVKFLTSALVASGRLLLSFVMMPSFHLRGLLVEWRS